MAASAIGENGQRQVRQLAAAPRFEPIAAQEGQLRVEWRFERGHVLGWEREKNMSRLDDQGLG